MELKNNITDFLNDSSGVVSRLRDYSWKDIGWIIQALKGTKVTDQKVFIAGNGGSASTASHFASDLIKKSKLKSYCLNDNISLITALANDIGWDYIYEEQLKRLAKEGDFLVVISTKGGISEAGIHSKNLIKAVEYMNEVKGITIGLSGGDGGYFNKCHFNLIVDSESIPIIESVHSLICHLIAFQI